jgi:hypothetical protein
MDISLIFVVNCGSDSIFEKERESDANISPTLIPHRPKHIASKLSYVSVLTVVSAVILTGDAGSDIHSFSQKFLLM